MNNTRTCSWVTMALSSTWNIKQKEENTKQKEENTKQKEMQNKKRCKKEKKKKGKKEKKKHPIVTQAASGNIELQ